MYCAKTFQNPPADALSARFPLSCPSMACLGDQATRHHCGGIRLPLCSAGTREAGRAHCLGIRLDTHRMEASLPVSRRNSVVLAPLLQPGLNPSWANSPFAAQVVVPGRIFMRRMRKTCKRFRNVPRHYRITLSHDWCNDIQWWKTLLTLWNGKSFFLYQEVIPATGVGLFTDAIGTLGWGAFYAKECCWDTQSQELSIENKELYTSVAVCSTWGHKWCCLRIAVPCDNQAVVDCIA